MERAFRNVPGREALITDAAGRLREEILSTVDLSRDMSDEELKSLVDMRVSEYALTHNLMLKERGMLQKRLFNSMRKLDVLEDLMDDPDITEIMVNGSENIFFEKTGQLYKSDKSFSSKEKLADVIQQIVSGSNRMVNEASPIVDARLADGSRVNVVLCPVSVDGAAISIRRFPKEPITMEGLIERESITREAAEFLKTLVLSGYNIFISGSTGSGKTTFLNALSQYIPAEERIVTIEDSAELVIIGKENIVRLEARSANTEGVEEITIRDLIRTSLRMRPDRIIVGECRGAEALDVLQAMNTGHDGSLSTGHANSCRDMVSRLETMVLMGMELPVSAIRSQIASGIDIMVHLGRMRDKTRKVLSISETDGVIDGEVRLNELFRFIEEKESKKKVCGRLTRVGHLKNCEKCIRAGCQVPEETLN